MSNWVPGKENERLSAFQVLSRELAQRPQVYGVSAADAAQAVRLVEELQSAIDAASNPATRTAPAVAAKRECLEGATKFMRRLASFIRLNPSVSETDLMVIGLPPRAEKRRVPPPSTRPLLSILGVIPGGHQIGISDDATPDRLGKPADTRGLELFVAYSASGAGEALGADSIVKNGKPHGLLTRGRSSVIHPNERLGSVANYVGRWVNTRGEAGPFSQPVRMALVLPADSRLGEAA